MLRRASIRLSSWLSGFQTQLFVLDSNHHPQSIPKRHFAFTIFLELDHREGHAPACETASANYSNLKSGRKLEGFVTHSGWSSGTAGALAQRENMLSNKSNQCPKKSLLDEF